jgi:hypothetical protein
LKYKIKM